MKIMIFSGTTEGRKLSEMLTERGIRHFVCVASKYGNEVMSTDPGDIHIGRMDADMMIRHMRSKGFSAGDVAVDATHPYADEARRNIRGAAGELKCTLIRIKRPSGVVMTAGGGQIAYSSMTELAMSMDDTDGNILLTTGSSELETYSSHVSSDTLKRTYVRVIATVESLEKCTAAGVEGSHIIAMQGPFSYEMNRAMMIQYGIRHVITKESGANGGYLQKSEAAKDVGAVCHVITRPDASDEGVDIFEAFRMITGCVYEPKRSIVIAGGGMGGERGLTKEAEEAIRSADALFGAAGVTGDISHPRKYDMYLAGDIINVLDKERDIHKAVILFSGDSGFYSGAKNAYKLLKDRYKDAQILVLPGVSSVSYLAAKLGISWDDALLRSVHGRDDGPAIDSLVQDIMRSRKTFVLLSGGRDLPLIAGRLNGCKEDITIYAGRNLSREDESMDVMTPEEALNYDKDGKITALFINEQEKDD
ncbi:MAG: precorrin-6A reductase [Lachnospiraceae bacterium]|nr:precorrin-6A reductase [Lachnospiraceae bacterium]